MDESDLKKLLQEGIAAAKAAQQDATGTAQREQARQLLLRVIELDERNIAAWLWLSVVLVELEEKRICLENALALDPTNKQAQLGLARLDQQASISVAQPTPDEPPPLSAIIGQEASPNPSPRTQSPSKYRRLGEKPAGLAKPAAPKSEGVPCPFCRQTIPTTVALCPYCRLPLVMNCPACGDAVDVEQKNCPQCNQRMGNYRQRLTYFAELAAAYQQHQRYAEAVSAWQTVETLQPDYPKLYLYLGEAQVGLGRLDRATDNLQRALKKEPDSAPAHFALAELLRQRGEIEDAYPYYLKATRLDPQHGLAWLRLGQLYEQARRRQDAAQAYKRAAALLETGSTERALAEQQQVHLQPGLPMAMATGWAELLRQMTGPTLICLLMALLDAGLRPWWIPGSGWLALCLAPLGIFLYVSGTSLPRNPLICLLVGEQGVSSDEARASIAIIGMCCWLLAVGLILLPLGKQSFPEAPRLPS